MKKFYALVLVLFFLIAMVSCGGKKTETAKNSVAESAPAKAVVKKETVKVTPTLTIKIGDKEEKYTDLTIIKTGTPTSHDYEVSANVDKDGNVGVGLEFTYENGALTSAGISIKGYKITKKDIKMDKFVTHKNKLGLDKLDHLSITFSGEAKKEVKLGEKPSKEIIQFNGTVVK